MSNRPLVRRPLALALLLSLPLAAHADSWTGTGELGLAITSGNAKSENINGKLAFLNEDDQWKHSFALGVLRAKGEVVGDFDGDGEVERSRQLTANRYDFAAGSAYKMSPRSSWVASLRYENDDFAPFDSQTTFSIGYGYQWVDTETSKLRSELGPGYRRAKSSSTGDTEGELILRGALDFSHVLSDTAKLVNTFLIESGSDNTFLQNELGVSVSINQSLALKAGLQARHNSEVGPLVKKTDTLTTMNLVYTFK